MKSEIMLVVVDEKNTFVKPREEINIEKINSAMIPVLSTLFLALCVSSPIAQAAATSTTFKNICSGHRVSVPLSSSRTWLPLNHRYGPCSPFPSSAERAPPPSTAAVLHRDQLRAAGIVRRKGLNNGTTVPTTLGTSLHTLQYVVTVGLGSPAVNQTVHVDTGSDVSWVQCRRCPAPLCHRQTHPLFDPAKSSTYSPVPCASPACAALGTDADGCSGRRCRYTVIYGDGSNTTGTYGADTLTLGPGGHAAVDGFRFGCSHAAQMFGADRADGLLGLGGGKTSLVSQTAATAFSYCLPPSASYSGFLSLGAPPSSSRFAVTPMHRSSDETFYIVRLEAIAVAGRRLAGVPASAFAAGAVVDSGTVITRLPPAAYRALRAAVRREMRTYRRAAPPSPIFDTCFDLTGSDVVVEVPSVALVFDGGATVELDRSGVMIDGCLAFASNGDDAAMGIIGNVQQRTLEVLYDIGGGAVGFRRGAC